ncbi:MauE/DoxX family redox-associated membrane protein [Bailinhaonella thermotolerans]|uniref:MauE/DoxX family redox-associated membrane protein n=1 Tax=Bailinhaonella thermotolerans TaxID=1070861 RepID=UPI00192A5227|nr:MauE/DoxX family redox-associated membrane protein [Bailinhaonella thermotolerans]
MWEAIRAAQVPLLVVLLAVGGLAKLASLRGDDERVLGPAALVPGAYRPPVVALAGLAELALAGALAVSAHDVWKWAAAGLFAISAYVLVEVRRRRPDAGCGCFGEVSAAPVGARTILRPVLLAVLALISLGVPGAGWEVVAGMSPAHAAALLVALTVLAFLSPELEESLARMRYRAPCEVRPVPPERALARLRASAVWRSHERMLTSVEPYDSWRELCWRFFVYRGESQGRRVDVVFAVYLTGRRPAVRVTLVDPELLEPRLGLPEAPGPEGTGAAPDGEPPADPPGEPPARSPGDDAPGERAGRGAARARDLRESRRVSAGH